MSSAFASAPPGIVASPPQLRVKHWLPVSRANFGYFLRWFFWSGVAHAFLGSDDPLRDNGTRRAIPSYFVQNFFGTSLRAVYELAKGSSAKAAAAATRQPSLSATWRNARHAGSSFRPSVPRQRSRRLRRRETPGPTMDQAGCRKTLHERNRQRGEGDSLSSLGGSR